MLSAAAAAKAGPGDATHAQVLLLLPQLHLTRAVCTSCKGQLRSKHTL
jgi:hypothetical protein